jgi:hypothetical protein
MQAVRTLVQSDADTVYMSAGWLRHNLRVSDHMLMRMLSHGAVRVMTNAGPFPLYSVADVRKYLREEKATHEEKSTPARSSKPRRKG